MALIVGIDEVGLGPIAGPLLVGAVVLPDTLRIKGVRDSKKLSDGRRRSLVHDIDQASLYWIMALSGAKEIDKYGVSKCHMACMKWCARICLLRFPEAVVIVDGSRRIPGVPREKQEIIPKADDTVMAVSAASVMAKVQRDNLMEKASTKYPLYGFHGHKGYPTRFHLDQLEKHGPCPLHRRSYRPVARVLAAVCSSPKAGAQEGRGAEEEKRPRYSSVPVKEVVG